MARLKHVLSCSGRFVDRVEEWSNLVGTWLIVLLMLLITSDVAYRLLTGRSLLGAFELAQLTMVAICFLPVAFTQMQRGHITMEVVVSRLRGRTAQFTGIVALFLFFVICSLICYQTTAEAQVAVAIRQTTGGVIKWPAWPVKITLAFAFFLLCIRIGVQLIQRIRPLIAGGEHHAV